MSIPESWFQSLLLANTTLPASRPVMPEQPLQSYLLSIVFFLFTLVPGVSAWWMLGRRGGNDLDASGWSMPRVQTPRDAASLWLGGGLMVWCYIAVPSLRPLVETMLDGDASTEATAASGLDGASIVILAAMYVVGLTVAGVFHAFWPGSWSRTATLLGLTLRKLPRQIVQSLIVIAIALPLTYLASVLTQLAWQIIQYEHDSAHSMLLLMDESRQSQWVLILTIVCATVLAPVFEELFFRGHLQTALGTLFRSRWPAILITSVLFMLVHAPWTWPAIFVLSVVIGYAYEKIGSLWVAIAAHVAFNATSTALHLLSQQ